MADRPGVPLQIKLRDSTGFVSARPAVTEASGAQSRRGRAAGRRLRDQPLGTVGSPSTAADARSPAATLNPAVAEWVARIDAATTAAALKQIGEALAAVKATLTDDTRIALRARIKDRSAAISGKKKPPAPVTADDVRWSS